MLRGFRVTAKPLRVGLIGLGAQGRTHISCLLQLDQGLARSVGLCDLSATTLATAGEHVPDARTETDYRRLLDSVALDLVIISTMPHSHEEICCATFEHGIHVLCEKPFAPDAGQVRRILDAADHHGCQVQLGTNMRYMPRATHLRALIGSGRIGTPLQCLVRGVQGNPPLWGMHHHRAASGGGVLAASTLHNLDLAMWISGSPSPVSVCATMHTQFPAKRGKLMPADSPGSYDVEDLLAALVRFDDGSTFLIEGNWCEDVKPTRVGFELVTTKGTVGSNPFFVARDVDGEPVDETPALPANDWSQSIRDQNLDVITRILEERPLEMHDAHQLLSLQRVIDGCYESASRGREVACG